MDEEAGIEVVEDEEFELTAEMLMEKAVYDAAVAHVQEVLDHGVAAGMDAEQLRALLNSNEIDGDAADIYYKGENGYRINVWGPNLSTITVESW